MLKNLYGEKRVACTQHELNTILLAHERYVSYRGGARAQLARTTLDGLILANRTLTEADFSGASLMRASLYGSNLERASLYCADLRECNLQAANLKRADLRGASFKGARLAYAVLDHADLRAAMMAYSDGGVSAAGNEHNDQRNSPSRVDFSNCSMKGASFGNAKLEGADFSGAILHGANFKNAKLVNVTFEGAVLTGVNLKDLSVPLEALRGCVTDVTPEAASKFDQLKVKLEMHQQWVASGGKSGSQAIFDGEDLRPLRELLIGSALSGLSARNTNCIGIDFSGSELQAAKFDGADMRDANFANADMRGASLRGARLSHAIFENTNLGRLPLTSGYNLMLDLTGADATEEQFRGALLEDRVTAFGLVPAAALLAPSGLA
ncbi:MAG: pentapeptide repeat-containing protein [Rhizomicrobium sp.]